MARPSPASVLRQYLHQAGGVPAVAAAGLHLAVELVHQRGDRQAGAVGLGFGQADAEILAHPVDREAEIELALAHGGAPVVHLPGLRGALADDLRSDERRVGKSCVSTLSSRWSLYH